MQHFAGLSRILVVGCSGAGKSTFARRLGEATGLPVHHMDTLYWQPGWVEPDRAEFAARLAEVAAGERWVIDGNFSATLPERLVRAEAVVWPDLPRRVCVLSILRRLARYCGRTRPDLPAGCPEQWDADFMRWVWRWHSESRPRLLALLDEAPPEVRQYRVRSRAELNRLLK